MCKGTQVQYAHTRKNVGKGTNKSGLMRKDGDDRWLRQEMAFDEALCTEQQRLRQVRGR